MNDLTLYNTDTKIADKNDYDVYLANEYINSQQAIPYLYFPSAETPLMFYQTRDTLADIDRYKSFIDNCIRQFRKSRTYKSYKSYLMSLGMDRCQVNGNIQDGMADIEMHHNFLTIYDITILISQHVLNTVGMCTTFDIVALLMQEHKENNIPIVMLSETAHELFHANPDAYIPVSMTFGKWWDLLIKYRYGITLDIAYKVIKYITNCQRNNELSGMEFYKLSQDIQTWGEYNEYAHYNNFASYLPTNLINSGNLLPRNEPYQIAQTIQSSQSPEVGFGMAYSEAEVFG